MTVYPSKRPVTQAKTALSIIAFGFLPLLLLYAFTISVIGHHFAFDFHTFWTAGRKVLEGHSPYPSPGAIAHARSTTGAYEFFVYPPPFLLALLPLSVLPFAVAAVFYTTVLVACVLAVPALLGVRDWRCYGIALATIPTLSSFRLGAVTPLLALLVAIAWRYRGRWQISGAAVGCAIVLKLFVWPLVLWLIVSRRWKAAALAVTGGTAVTALAWTIIGFKGLSDYTRLLGSLDHLEAKHSYSLVALADRLHLPDPNLSWLTLAVPLVAALAATGFASCHRADFDRSAYVTALGLAILLTPILWLHYLALLLVPVALSENTLGIGWILLLALWVSPWQQPTNHPAWRLAFVLTVAVAVISHGRRSRGAPSTASTLGVSALAAVGKHRPQAGPRPRRTCKPRSL